MIRGIIVGVAVGTDEDNNNNNKHDDDSLHGTPIFTVQIHDG